jgi:hypothetical protein
VKEWEKAGVMEYWSAGVLIKTGSIFVFYFPASGIEKRQYEKIKG